jgi:hypothetical protein
MLFGLEVDTGELVMGYLVPDSFSGVCTIRVVSGGTELLVMPTQDVRESLVVANRHDTGRCGFALTDKEIPNIREIADLEIYDAETGLLVYRRPQPGDVKKKILRLELGLFPLWQMDQSVGAAFQHFAKGIESAGRETVTQMFLLAHIESVYLSGRILYRNYAYYVEAGFETIIAMQDPYCELAERLLVLSKINKFGGAHLGLRDNLGLKAAMDFAEKLSQEGLLSGDVKALGRALSRMPDDVAAALANPYVRQLTCATPDAMPSGPAVASALDSLSTFAVVGLRQNADDFLDAVAELVNVSPASLPQLPQFSTVPPLAAMLKNTRQVDMLLEKDLELYNFVVEAGRKSDSPAPAA